MRWTGHVACRREKKNVQWVYAGKPEEKRPLGRPKHRLSDKNSIKMAL